jgi:hypothetical protein
MWKLITRVGRVAETLVWDWESATGGTGRPTAEAAAFAGTLPRNKTRECGKSLPRNENRTTGVRRRYAITLTVMPSRCGATGL